MTSIINRISLLPSTFKGHILKFNKYSSRSYHTKNGIYGQPKELENALDRSRGHLVLSILLYLGLMTNGLWHIFLIELRVQEDYRLSSFISSFRGFGYSLAKTDVLNLNEPRY